MERCKIERCTECPFFEMNRQLGYYNFPFCGKNLYEITFNAENGWDKMKWCPMDKEAEEEDEDE